MNSKSRFQNLVFDPTLSPASAALAIMLTIFFLILLLLLMNLTALPAQAQTYKVLYSFTGGASGGGPQAGLTMDNAGNLYGTAQDGGKYGYGTVFKLSNKGSGWIFTPLYSFQGGNDGANPTARVIFGPDGSLYGTTQFGGGTGCYRGWGCGTVFNLRPLPRACTTALCPWTETVLYSFSGSDGDGAYPTGDLIFDQAGAIYGAATEGGLLADCQDNYIPGCGVVYKLAPSQRGWTETVLYSFTAGSDGAYPGGGVIFDNAGSLYGTTGAGGRGQGTVYELTPSGSAWQEKTLYSFFGAGWGSPVGGLIFDASGNLYGTTSGYFLVCAGGDVYELTPSNGNWTVTHGVCLGGGMNGGGPSAGVVMDARGNLYGTSENYPPGTVFEVYPDWSLHILYGFSGGSDGGAPYGTLVVDASGNIYGTTFAGGVSDNGVVWEITP